MPGSSDQASQFRWLLEPPASSDVRLILELGENARLTPGAQQALDQLMKELYETEVQQQVTQCFRHRETGDFFQPVALTVWGDLQKDELPPRRPRALRFERSTG